MNNFRSLKTLPAIPEPDVEPVEDLRILFRLDAAEGEIDGDGLLRSELHVWCDSAEVPSASHESRDDSVDNCLSCWKTCNQ